MEEGVVIFLVTEGRWGTRAGWNSGWSLVGSAALDVTVTLRPADIYISRSAGVCGHNTDLPATRVINIVPVADSVPFPAYSKCQDRAIGRGLQTLLEVRPRRLDGHSN